VVGAAQNTTLERARAEFLRDGLRPVAAVVRPPILASWHRSALYGLRPNLRPPAVIGKVDHDNHIARAARPVVEARTDVLKDVACGITLTNSTGLLLERWVESPVYARRLDARGVVPGGSVAEMDVGTTSSGIALETGQSVLVIGPEHFADGAIRMSTAGAPIRDPVTHRILGTVNLACGQADTSPFMLQWIRDLATLIEGRLLDSASSRERALLQTYLTGDRDSRHPVICMNEHTIIGNASAARLIGDLDPAVVWETASKTVQSHTEQRVELMTARGSIRVEVIAQPIVDGDEVVGARMHLRRHTLPLHTSANCDASGPRSSPAACDPAAVLPGMSGRSAAWRRFCEQLTRFPGEPLLLTGEPGTGKSMTLAALAPLAVVLDAQRSIDDDTCWLVLVHKALRSGAQAVALDSLEALSTDVLGATMSAIAARGPHGPLVLAARTHNAADELNPGTDNGVSAWPGIVVRVPPVRERIGDIPLLLTALTAAATVTTATPRWSTEAIQTLTRVHWIANVSSLGRLVSTVLRQRTPGPTIGNDDLPTAVKSSGTRKQLFGLDLVEAHAINAALVAAAGNKKLAADYLGIARSTLYRKVRALGIDLGGAAY
jgi:sigma-54 dependent transcriptional regulator, acetoin dehydrogenase operon transcriptional activator AcoR